MRISGLPGLQPFARSARAGRSSLETTLGRLSSGLRIQRAADDAAGSGVAVNLETEARSQRVALRNIESAFGLVNVTDQALSSQTALLQRGRELAVAASSETLGDRDRAALQEEFAEILVELDRIASTTSFEGNLPLRGTTPRLGVGLVFQTAPYTSRFLRELQSDFATFQAAFGDQAVDFGFAEVGGNADSVDNVRLLSQMGSGTTADAIANLTSGSNGNVDVWTALTETAGTTAAVGVNENDAFSPSSAVERRILILMTGDFVGQHLFGSASRTEASVAAELAAAGWEVHIIGRSQQASNYQQIVSATGGSFQNIFSGVGAALTNIASGVTASSGAQSLTLQVGTGSTAADRLETELPVNTRLSSLSLTGATVATRDGARSALAALDSALQTVQGHRSYVGALSQRLTHQQAIAERAQLTAEQSRSVIEDADFAQETAELTRRSILADVASAALVQTQRFSRGGMVALLSPEATGAL